MPCVVIHKDLGHGARGDGCVIAVFHGQKSMKKLISKVKGPSNHQELSAIAKRMNRQWNNGLLIIPDDYKYELVEEGWVACEKMKPPEGQMVLTWVEHEIDGNLEQTYGFGTWEGDGWVVYLQEASRVIAWMQLPEPYIEKV